MITVIYLFMLLLLHSIPEGSDHTKYGLRVHRLEYIPVTELYYLDLISPEHTELHLALQQIH